MPDSPSTAWIDALLRGWLGPGATTGELGFEGPVLRIERASLPLGALRLDVERAEIELGAGAPLGELPLSARLVSLRAVLQGEAGGVSVAIELTAADAATRSWFSGTVRVRGAAPRVFDVSASLDVAPAGGAPREAVAGAGTSVAVAVALGAAGSLDGSRVSGRVALSELLALGLPGVAVGPESVLELDLTAHGSLAELALRGRVFAAVVALSRRPRSEGPALRLENVHASIDVTRRRLRYQDLRGEAHGARFAGWGRVPLGARVDAVPLAALAVEGAGVALVRAVAAVAGAKVRVPADLAVTGELMVQPSLAASGAFAVETPRTQLLFQLAVTPGGSLVGSTLRGRLAAADAITVGIFDSPVRPRPPAVLDVDARLTGTTAKPGITGRVACASFTLDVSADAAAPSFVVEDASVLLDIDAEGIAWHRSRGRFYGGTFSASGRAGHASGLHATVAWSGVRVELLPTQASGPSRLSTSLHGASTGQVRFDRGGHASASLTALGHLAVASPIYLFTGALRPQLERFGLPRVRSRGKGPLSARLHLDSGVLRIASLSAAVDGVEVAGDVHLGLDGALGGRVVVHLLESYLGQSALLSIPAALAGRVSVPVDLGGTVRAPEVRTDAWEILEGLLSGNRVVEAARSVLDGLRGAAPKRR